MNNLYRELAPISDAAWADLEEEAKRTFATYVAGRRIVDVDGPGGPELAAVNTGRLGDVTAPADGVIAHLRQSQPLVRLRVPFTLSRYEIDSGERGAQDADWQPVKDAAKQIGFAEDRAIFEGYEAAGITGLRDASSNTALGLLAFVLTRRALAVTRSSREMKYAFNSFPGDTCASTRRGHASSKSMPSMGASPAA